MWLCSLLSFPLPINTVVCLIENMIENIPVSDCVDDKTKMGLCVDDEMMISKSSQQHMNNGEQAIQTEMNE
jgi:hypothetical protein